MFDLAQHIDNFANNSLNSPIIFEKFHFAEIVANARGVWPAALTGTRNCQNDVGHHSDHSDHMSQGSTVSQDHSVVIS